MSEARKIFCGGCQRYCGEIRDAKLLKGLVHICPACDAKRIVADMMMRNKELNKASQPFGGVFDDLFGGLGKGGGGSKH